MTVARLEKNSEAAERVCFFTVVAPRGMLASAGVVVVSDSEASAIGWEMKS